MKIYLARHGRTNYNDLRLCNADPSVDVHLTPAGTEQAKALANRLIDVPIEHIFVSELKRTQQIFGTPLVSYDFLRSDIFTDPNTLPEKPTGAQISAEEDRSAFNQLNSFVSKAA